MRRWVDAPNAEEFSITLPAEMARLIRDKASRGEYGFNSEVIREALRGWIERDRRLAALDSAIGCGVADAEAGRVQSVAAVRTALRKRFKGKAATRA
jgi:antitoxin ParD1/3/4